MVSDDPILGPFPLWRDWVKARGGDPADPNRWSLLSDSDNHAAALHTAAWVDWHVRQSAKARAAHRATLPHPNWLNRHPMCSVMVPSGVLMGGMGPVTKRKQSPWLRVHDSCGAPCVAWDGTDRRAVGHLRGACPRHLLRALYDDGTRDWYWRDGTPLNPATDDLDATFAYYALVTA